NATSRSTLRPKQLQRLHLKFSQARRVSAKHRGPGSHRNLTDLPSDKLNTNAFVALVAFHEPSRASPDKTSLTSQALPARSADGGQADVRTDCQSPSRV